MKKILIILIMLLFVNVAFAVNSYDRYGQKTGSYKQTTSGYNSYDRYGSKTGSYKETSSGYNKYDKYGQKTGSYKKHPQDIIPMTSMVRKLVVTRQILMV